MDATSLKHTWRDQLHRVAAEARARFVLLECRADTAVLYQRVKERKLVGKDASEASSEVLASQLARLEPLQEPHLMLDTSSNLTEQQVVDFANQSILLK